ncbi:MAG: hypothetical protein VYC68_02815 [Candidatus Thermoplasmatota archaeon]|nr:hypothetical protein [Candidatus Thermoplasmatota archaeon]
MPEWLTSQIKAQQRARFSAYKDEEGMKYVCMTTSTLRELEESAFHSRK